MTYSTSTLAVLIAGYLLISSAGAHAEDDKPLTGARLLSQIARQPEQIRPLVFSPVTNAEQCDIAFVIDGTTSMPIEIVELAEYFDDAIDLLSPADRESTRVAIVVYRDEDSPSGYVTVVRPLTKDLEQIRQDLGDIEVESGEPFITEVMDQGLHAAIDQLEWREGANTLRRIMIIGDAGPYPEHLENRKYRTAELRELAKKKNVRIDALFVNSGFAPTVELPGAPTREKAIKAAPYAREFFTALTVETRGTFVDLWRADEVAALQEVSVVIANPPTVSTPADGEPAFPTAAAWQRFLAKHVRSVRAERPALLAVEALAALQPRESAVGSPFSKTYPAEGVQTAIDHLDIALEEEAENPVLHLMLANLHLLLAYHDAYEEHSQAAIRHIAAAHAYARDDLPTSVRHEIDGLHAILIAADREGAIVAFQKLNSADNESSNPGCRLRACWNFLALELTFWPVTAADESASSRTTIDEPVCKALIETLAETWPESVEAQALNARLSSSGNKSLELPQSLFTFPRAN